MPESQQPPASRGPQITTSQRLEDYNVLAAFESMDKARGAIEALGLAGIEGQHLTLQGAGPDEVDSRSSVRDTDARLLGRWLALSSAWGLAGALAGLVLGIPVGVATLVIFGADVNGENAGVSALFGALSGGIIGWLIGVFYHVQAGDTWELSFHQAYAGKAIVGVHSADRVQVDKACGILKKQGALTVRMAGRYDRPSDAVRMTERRA
jgi:hypothetical protein